MSSRTQSRDGRAARLRDLAMLRTVVDVTSMSNAMERMGWLSRAYGVVLAMMHLSFLLYLLPVTIAMRDFERDPYLWLMYAPMLPATAFMIYCGVALTMGRERKRWFFLIGAIALPVVQVFAIGATVGFSWHGGGGRSFPYTMLLSAVATMYHIAGAPLLFTRLRYVNLGM